MKSKLLFSAVTLGIISLLSTPANAASTFSNHYVCDIMYDSSTDKVTFTSSTYEDCSFKKYTHYLYRNDSSTAAYYHTKEEIMNLWHMLSEAQTKDMKVDITQEDTAYPMGTTGTFSFTLYYAVTKIMFKK